MVLDRAKSLPSCKKSLGVVLAGSQTSLGVAFGAGTHLVIYKPITPDRVRNGLRAVRTLAARQHPRESHRIRVDVPATLHSAGKSYIPVSLVDISEGGVALRVEQALPASPKIKMMLSLSLPGTAITASVEIVWRDVKRASRRPLCQYATRFPQNLATMVNGAT